MRLKLVSLNVNGFRRVGKQTDVMNFAWKLRCDLLLLQETHFYCQRDIFRFQQRFRVRCFFSPGTPGSCGVGVVVFNRTALNKFYCCYDADGRLLGYDFELSPRKIRILNVYAPAQADKTNGFFSSIDVSFSTAATLIWRVISTV